MYVDTFMMRLPEIRITGSNRVQHGKMYPEDFVCPLCGVGKDQFSEVE